MRKFLSIIIISLLLQPFLTKADEGMWLPMFIERLNYVDMQKQGIKLTPEEIYSINNASLKDAIVHFGGGCTGEIISDQGLILTNHHCGYSYIQSHSTVAHDYLTDGFWAMKKSDELANDGLTVSFLIRMDDVTKKVLAEVTDKMTESERDKKIEEIIEKLKKENSENGKYNVVVRSFFHGNEYYMFIYEVYKDVRLVGAPPSSIGKFGGDTDNWMWPRHTGDFSLFRVYMSPDGKPAAYSPDNVPYKPKHHLPISIKGVDLGEFSMILGYPGTTDRFLTSHGVASTLELKNPTLIKILDKRLALMRQDMAADPAVRIQYASKYASTANVWKKYIGMSKGLKRLKVYDSKLKIEEDFVKWVNADENRKAKYGSVLNDLDAAYKEQNKYVPINYYLAVCLNRGSELYARASMYIALYNMLSDKTTDAKKIEQFTQRVSAELDKFFKDYNLPTDKKITAAMIEMFRKDIPKEQYPTFIIEIDKKYKGNVSAYVDKLFAKSIFCDKAKTEAFLKKPSLKVLVKDPAFIAALSIKNRSDELRKNTKEINEKLSRSMRLFVAGLREMNPDKIYYPDANSTMRLTYGTVMAYTAADAVFYRHYTTIEGIMEKEDPSNPEFVVPAKLKELFKNKDYGRYGNQTINVAFITNHDITGGNSGSPVINGKGELIGLAFDGNWEAMSGDIAFEPDLQRTINVDIRYVLFIIDKFAGAKNIIDELTIVN